MTVPEEASVANPAELSIPTPTPSSQLRSLVTTAQDWPRVRKPFPSRPSFGPIRGEMHSLPAFQPPAELALAGGPGLESALEAPAVLGQEDDLEAIRRSMRPPQMGMFLAATGAAIVFATILIVWLTH